MKNLILLVSSTLLMVSCSSHSSKNTNSSSDINEQENVARKLASPETKRQIFSTKEEIKEFLDQANCVIKAQDNEGKLIYTRNLNKEIEEGYDNAMFSTKIYVEEARDNENHSFSNIFVAHKVNDPYGEEIHIAFAFDKTNIDRPLFHGLFINNDTSLIQSNSKVWNSLPSLTGVDFKFKLTRSQRLYTFRCDTK